MSRTALAWLQGSNVGSKNVLLTAESVLPSVAAKAAMSDDEGLNMGSSGSGKVGGFCAVDGGVADGGRVASARTCTGRRNLTWRR